MVRMFVIVAVTFMLQSCSYSYAVFATVIGGRLAFVSGDDEFDCIATINVSREGPRDPDPAIDNLDDLVAAGDAIARVRAAWHVDGLYNECKAGRGRSFVQQRTAGAQSLVVEGTPPNETPACAAGAKRPRS